MSYCKECFINPPTEGRASTPLGVLGSKGAVKTPKKANDATTQVRQEDFVEGAKSATLGKMRPGRNI